MSEHPYDCNVELSFYIYIIYITKNISIPQSILQSIVSKSLGSKYLAFFHGNQDEVRIDKAVHMSESISKIESVPIVKVISNKSKLLNVIHWPMT